MFTFVVLCSFNLPNLITLKIIFPDPFQIFYSDCVPGFPYSRPCLFWAENLTFQFNKNLHIRLDFSVNTVSSLGSFCNITFPFPTFPVSTKTHYSFSLYQSKKPPILAATLRVASFLLPEAISQIFPSSYVTWVPC